MEGISHLVGNYDRNHAIDSLIHLRMRTSRHQYQERHFEDHTPDTGDGLIEYTRITLENALEKELISQLEYERATAEGYTHLRRDAETGEFLGKGKKAIKLY